MALKEKIKTKYKIIEKYPETPNYKTGEVIDGIAIYPEEIERVAKKMEVPVHYVKYGVLLHEFIHKEYPKLSPKEFSEKFEELYLKLFPDIEEEYFKKILDFSGHFSEADMEIYKKYGEIKVVNPQNPNNPNMNNSIPTELEPLVEEMRKYKSVEEFLDNLKKVIDKRLPELRKSYEELERALTTKWVHTSTKIKKLSNFRTIGKELTKEIAHALGYKDIIELPFKIGDQLRILTSEYSFGPYYTSEKWIDLLNKRISEMTEGLKFADLFNFALKSQNPNNPENPSMENEVILTEEEKLPKFESYYQLEDYLNQKFPEYVRVLDEIFELERELVFGGRKYRKKEVENEILGWWNRDLGEKPSVADVRTGYFLMWHMKDEIKKKLGANPSNPENPRRYFTRDFKPEDFEEDWIELELEWNATTTDKGFIKELEWSGVQELKVKGKKRYLVFFLRVGNIKKLSSVWADRWYSSKVKVYTHKKDLGKRIPFAGSSEDKIWWLATTENGRVEIEVSNVRGYSATELEYSFSDSFAQISDWWEISEESFKRMKGEIIPSNPESKEISWIDISDYFEDGILRLDEFKKKTPKEFYERFKKYWKEETGEDLEDRIKTKDPLYTTLYTLDALKEEYLEVAEESGVPENFIYYLDAEAMIEDDMTSGYLDYIKFGEVEVYYRTY
jgi:hypothetical protein